MDRFRALAVLPSDVPSRTDDDAGRKLVNRNAFRCWYHGRIIRRCEISGALSANHEAKRATAWMPVPSQSGGDGRGPIARTGAKDEFRAAI